MKKAICILLALGLLAAGSLPAYAGGRYGYPGPRAYRGYHGNGIGEFFVGLVGGAILGTIIANSQAQAHYAPPPPAYVPPARVWVPGRYETRYEQEWVPGHYADDGYADDGEIPYGRFKVREREVLPVPQYFTQAVGLESTYATEPVFVREPQNQFLQTLLISTSYMSSKVNPQLLMVYDWGGAFVLQPGVTLVRDPFRVVLDYTFITAGTLKGGSGVSLLRDRDNVQIRFEYVL